MTKPHYYGIKPHNLYGNCLMLSPDGLPMCRCDKEKMDWYVSRKLARILTTRPLVFQLTFEPRDKGHSGKDGGPLSAYFLAPKKNRCCVCGNRKHLTRHHCVPYLYRRYFSMDIKRHNSHDIVMLCPKCHWKYEREADKLKIAIVAETGIPLNGCSRRNPEEYRAHRLSSLANSLLRYASKIPTDKLSAIRSEIDELAKRHIPPDEYSKLVLPGHRLEPVASHGKLVIEKMNVEDFIRRWRRHFIEVMKPRFLPDHWDVENPVRVRTGAHERD